MELLDGLRPRNALPGGRWDRPAEGGEYVRCLEERSFRIRESQCGAVRWIKSPLVPHTSPLGTWHVETQARIMF